MNLAQYLQNRRTRNAMRQVVRKHRFWFVDIPRTSSSSIRWELGAGFDPLYGKLSSWSERLVSDKRAAPEHLTARNVRVMLGARLWEGIYTFSVVRNPWDRTYSLYQYRIQREGFPSDMTFDEYCQRLLDVRRGSYDPFFKNQLHHMSSCDFLTDGEGNFIVKAVVSFEHRSKGLSIVGGEIGCANLGSRQKMLGSRQEGEPRPQMKNEAVDLISQAYPDDLKYLSYVYTAEQNTGWTMMNPDGIVRT